MTLVLSGLFILVPTVPFMNHVLVESVRFVRGDRGTGGAVASGHPLVDQLLKDYEKASGISLDFPVLVLPAGTFEESMYRELDHNGSMKLLSNLLPDSFKENLSRSMSDIRESIGVCIQRSNMSKVIYLREDYLESSDAGKIARLLAHELGHCVFSLPHAEATDSFMNAYPDSSPVPQEALSVGFYLNGVTPSWVKKDL
jgi:hypothetical protein